MQRNPTNKLLTLLCALEHQSPDKACTRAAGNCKEHAVKSASTLSVVGVWIVSHDLPSPGCWQPIIKKHYSMWVFRLQLQITVRRSGLTRARLCLKYSKFSQQGNLFACRWDHRHDTSLELTHFARHRGAPATKRAFQDAPGQTGASPKPQQQGVRGGASGGAEHHRGIDKRNAVAAALGKVTHSCRVLVCSKPGCNWQGSTLRCISVRLRAGCTF